MANVNGTTALLVGVVLVLVYAVYKRRAPCKKKVINSNSNTADVAVVETDQKTEDVKSLHDLVTPDTKAKPVLPPGMPAVLNPQWKCAQTQDIADMSMRAQNKLADEVITPFLTANTKLNSCRAQCYADASSAIGKIQFEHFGNRA